MKRLRLFAVGLLFVCLTADGRAGKVPAHPKRDALIQSGVSGEARVIVKVESGASGIVAGRVRGRGSAVLGEFPLIDALVVSASSAELDLLDVDDSVERISIDAPVASSASKAGGPPTDAALLSTLGLPAAGMTGRSVGVAVIDSGIEPASGDFTGIQFFDFTSSRSDAYDGYGHGTHVSGLIAGRGASSLKTPTGNLFQGVAPDARVISLKVLDAQGSGLTSTVISAIQFAVQNRRALGIDIINLSLGHPIYEPAATDPLVRAVEAAARAGIVVVAAAGNVGRNVSTGAPGYAGILSPGNAPSAITVGAADTTNTATRLDDVVTTYSSRGPTWYDGLAKPDLVAPGQGLVSAAATASTLYAAFPDRQVGVAGGPAKFLRLSGTSMAAAVTTGVAALVIQANRSAFTTPLTPNLVKAILEFTALPVGGADTLTQGRGELNAAGAVALALNLDPSADPGAWWAGNPISPITTIDGQTWSWAQSIVWGNTVVWGLNNWSDTVVWGLGQADTVVWGLQDTVVWGLNDAVWDDPSIWNTTVVWGLTWDDSIVTGNNADWGPN